MGITPITNFIPLTIASSMKKDLEPLPMERAENSARAGDETYSPSGGQSAAGSEEDAFAGENPEDATVEGIETPDADGGASAPSGASQAGINFFA
jgi:hypothetical protein